MISSLSRRLRADGFYATEEWLQQCSEFLQRSHTTALGPSASEYDRVIQMLVHSNLRDVAEEPLPPSFCLPQNLRTLHNTRLFMDHAVILQIEYARNVSVSTSTENSSSNSSQIAERPGNSDENGDDNVANEFEDAVTGAGNKNSSIRLPRWSKKSVLKIWVTDGFNFCTAYDFGGFLLACTQGNAQCGASVSEQQLCGAKLRVRNILVRRGALVLESDSTQLLGGLGSASGENSTLPSSTNASSQNPAGVAGGFISARQEHPREVVDAQQRIESSQPDRSITDTTTIAVVDAASVPASASTERLLLIQTRCISNIGRNQRNFEQKFLVRGFASRVLNFSFTSKERNPAATSATDVSAVAMQRAGSAAATMEFNLLIDFDDGIDITAVQVTSDLCARLLRASPKQFLQQLTAYAEDDSSRAEALYAQSIDRIRSDLHGICVLKKIIAAEAEAHKANVQIQVVDLLSTRFCEKGGSSMLHATAVQQVARDLLQLIQDRGS